MAYYLEEGDALNLVLTIISGWRTAELQSSLAHSAPENLSTHRSCPATGADIWLSVAATNDTKLRVGLAAARAGLRWGGGSAVDPNTQIPRDWNHLDLGRRT